ncbi:hypothetical protein V7128_01805 [Neobacillus vireti]|uniref:hypothetical protein n=1 Tax=Neobacillus vireti TaxID=220686 RepID=UPI002FFF39AD
MKGIICPYCNYEHENWQDFIDFEELVQDFDLDCEECGEWFSVHAEMMPKFITKIKS